MQPGFDPSGVAIDEKPSYCLGWHEQEQVKRGKNPKNKVKRVKKVKRLKTLKRVKRLKNVVTVQNKRASAVKRHRQEEHSSLKCAKTDHLPSIAQDSDCVSQSLVCERSLNDRLEITHACLDALTIQKNNVLAELHLAEQNLDLVCDQVHSAEEELLELGKKKELLIAQLQLEDGIASKNEDDEAGKFGCDEAWSAGRAMAGVQCVCCLDRHTDVCLVHPVQGRFLKSVCKVKVVEQGTFAASPSSFIDVCCACVSCHALIENTCPGCKGKLLEKEQFKLTWDTAPTTPGVLKMTNDGTNRVLMFEPATDVMDAEGNGASLESTPQLTEEQLENQRLRAQLEKSNYDLSRAVALIKSAEQSTSLPLSPMFNEALVPPFVAQYYVSHPPSQAASSHGPPSQAPHMAPNPNEACSQAGTSSQGATNSVPHPPSHAPGMPPIQTPNEACSQAGASSHGAQYRVSPPLSQAMHMPQQSLEEDYEHDFVEMCTERMREMALVDRMARRGLNGVKSRVLDKLVNKLQPKPTLEGALRYSINTSQEYKDFLHSIGQS